MSGIGQVTDAARIARAEAVTVAANVQSAIGTVQAIATLLSTHTDAVTAKAMSEMEARAQQVASYSDAQTSQATATLRQQVESEMVSIVASAEETAIRRTRDAKEHIRRKVEAKLQQEQATTRQQTDETRTAVGDIATKLDQLPKQLNEYKPAQEATVTAQGERLSADVEKRLELQSSQFCSIFTGDA